MADLVAEVLADHQPDLYDDGEYRWCRCGYVLANSIAEHATHQADSLRAKGLVVSEVEWAADLDGDMRPTGGRTIFRDQLERTIETWVSRGNPRPRVLTRGVTPWRTADEGSESHG